MLYVKQKETLCPRMFGKMQVETLLLIKVLSRLLKAEILLAMRQTT